MFASKERIELYKKLKEINKQIDDKKKAYEASNILEERNDLAVAINTLTVQEMDTLTKFHHVKDDGNYKMCDHIFIGKKEDSVYWCPNCGRYFIKWDNKVYEKEQFINSRDIHLIDLAGIPVLDIEGTDTYKRLLYLRGYAKYKDDNEVNLRALENNMLRLYDEDNDYQQYVDSNDNDLTKAVLNDYKKTYGLY